ncbi:MAG: GT4 family glycosyltransferase PelF [Planctomycetes bacterium]|nr:GT4 family glycosyltransferase PelF [Planctomycetota bacterium]
MSDTGPNDDRADVLLVLEGTYPFVMGGVSSWVHRIVGQMPDLRFGVVHIAPRVHFYGAEPAYQLPPNVVFLEEIGLVPERSEVAPRRTRRRHRGLLEAIWTDLMRLRAGDETVLEALPRRAARLSAAGLGSEDVLESEQCWDAIVASYQAEAGDQSFLNFYWTWRFAYQPVVELLFYRMPRAGMYHTVSTGYAGMLAAVAAAQWRRPMILTEHGIYTKERRIEVYSANWIRDVDDGGLVIDNTAPYFRQFWNRHFETLSRCCYREADRVFTLYGKNRLSQIADGADPDRCEIIPNGVDVDALTAAAEAAAAAGASERPFTVAFVGRVCPIKDVRTFLAAMRLVARDVPDVVVRVLGPMAEDVHYAEQCQTFARELGLDDNVRFEGPVDVKRELPHVDVLVLTSISEAQPLVVLEAGALGVPVVATDVGSCQELLEGRTPEDQALGIGGLIAPIASPGEIARHVLELWRDTDLRTRMGKSLQQRVRRFYDERDMIATYRGVYGDCLAAVEAV